MNSMPLKKNQPFINYKHVDCITANIEFRFIAESFVRLHPT